MLSVPCFASDMGLFLTAYLEKFPELADRPFWITGESYAGHYIPSIASYLLKHPIKGLNFQGIPSLMILTLSSTQETSFVFAHQSTDS